MLVLRANHTVPVEDLIGGLWADDPPPSAANLVQSTCRRGARRWSRAERPVGAATGLPPWGRGTGCG